MARTAGRSADETRQLILTSAARLIGRHGTTVPVTDIAEAAGVSRGWLYRHFPDKVTLLGAAIVRLNNAYWTDAHAMLASIDGLDNQIVTGIQHGRTAYDDPGALLMKLRVEEPDEFAACAGAGVQGLVPDLAGFWSRYLSAARDNGEIHADTDIDDASEWIARVILSLATMPGHQLDPDDAEALLAHVRRYVMPGLKAQP